MSYTLELQAIEPVTHDVNRLIFPKPDGYAFTPGQATELSLDRDGWRDEGRPFTFTSLPGDDHLEFTIKSYPQHDGVTERIGRMTPGDSVIIGDAWGAIEDRGPGTFIAGGAGITPFIAVLRARLEREGNLEGSTLLFSNETEKDIILRDEWEAMPGLRTVFTVTDLNDATVRTGEIDGAFLDAEVADWSAVFYVCGPEPMVEAIVDILEARDVPEDRIVTEEA
jgi:ferredoxin-NADP reductase